VAPSARLGRILDSMTMLTQEVFTSTLCVLVNEETARYVIMAHMATETRSVVGFPVCTDAFVENLLTASPATWCTGLMTSVAKESGIL